MKKKSQHFLLGKTATGLIAVLLLAGTVFAWNLLDSAVYAEADTVAVETVENVAYKVESHTDINAYRQNGNFTAPTYSGEGGLEKWLFAGWYTDIECTKSLSESIVSPNAANGTYYAKYVKKEVLSVRCQLKAETKADSADTILRCVSSVDSLKYKNIGLELVTPDGSVKRMRSQKVGTKINARDDISLSEFTYSPKAVDTESEYFFSATERISNSDFGKGYLVKPYWITEDGTCVYGVSKYVTVNGGMNRDVVYIPVQMAEQPAEGAAFTANEIAAAYVAYDENGGYAHLALNAVPTASATKYTIKNASGEMVGTSIYRNMTTSYNGAAESVDTSWYDVYNGEGETKFVIATSADLYGLATIVNGGNNLKGKTVYAVSDIDTNDEAGSYVWTRIGTDTKPFSGTFDGCMHSIKNIKVTSGTTGSGKGYGFFGQVNGGAILKNFKLIGGIYTFGQQMAGSVVGILQDATLDTVYSNAYVEGSYNYLGGLIGNKNSSGKAVVTNCWFDGTVNQKSGNSARITGGLLGRCGDNVELNNCLNTGDVRYNNLSTGALGGLVGLAEGTSVVDKLTINNCMNTGTITPKTGATANFGAIVGNIKTSDNVTIKNSFAISGTTLVNGAETHEGVTTATEANLTGTKAITSIPELFKYRTDDAEPDYRWVVVSNGTPVLKSFVSQAGSTAMGVDTSWYNESDTVYVLKDAADLYGFALLSKSNNFANKTVKLGADITVNEGKADEWAENAPKFDWIGIGIQNPTDYQFSGIFNGDNHTISGLYMNTATTYQGMFNSSTSNAVVEKFRLVNSYFESSARGIGSIAGSGKGKFDTIYSEAIVVGKGASVGGLLGQDGPDGAHMNNCWFAGSITNKQTDSSKGYGTGGLIGNVQNPSVITNCLNTGTITADKYDRTPRVGGLIGAVINKDAKISCCVNAGQIVGNEYSKENGGYGAFAGHIENGCTNMFSNSYAVEEFCGTFASGYNSLIDRTTSKLVAYADAKGEAAVTNMPGLFTENGKWTTVENGIPVLISFSEYAKDAGELSPLHLWLRNTVSPKVTLRTSQEVHNSDTRVFQQGGYTDGHYFWQAYITEKAYKTDDAGKKAEDIPNNKCKIVKTDLTGVEAPKYSQEFFGGHVNDITYNEKTEQLIVCTMNKDKELIFLDPDTLEETGSRNLTIYINNIDYNETKDQYVVGYVTETNTDETLGPLEASFRRFGIMNRDFTFAEEKFIPKSDTWDYVGQGVACDDEYIYMILSENKSVSLNPIIAVYDWEGNFVNRINLTIPVAADGIGGIQEADFSGVEAENISVVGNTIYVGVAVGNKTTNQRKVMAYSFAR